MLELLHVVGSVVFVTGFARLWWLMVTTHDAHTNHIQEGLFLWEALSVSASHSSPIEAVEWTDYMQL